MDAGINRCKRCGIVFGYEGHEIDKCAKKRLYCELCLAQKNPRSATEKKINKRYILTTATSAFTILAIIIGINWEQNKNDNFLEYLVGFGFGYLIIWGFALLLLLPILFFMKKPYRVQIKKEKELYIQEIEAQKMSRDTFQGRQKKASVEVAVH